jgi:hypothetical protein
METTRIVPNYISGEFRPSGSTRLAEVTNPANGRRTVARRVVEEILETTDMGEI